MQRNISKVIAIAAILSCCMVSCQNVEKDEDGNLPYLTDVTGTVDNQKENESSEQEEAEEEKIPIPDDWILLKEVDMEAFQAVMKAEEYTALMEYMDVLTGEVPFEWTEWLFDTTKTTNVTMDEFCSQLNMGVYESDGLWLDSLAVCDLTQDGRYELILLLRNAGNTYLILHKEGADFYGVTIIFRGFEMVQTNGVYIGSSGAAYNDYLQLVFEKNTFSEKRLGYTSYDSQNNIPLFYIGEEEVEEETFFEWVDSITSEDVQFYEPTFNM